MVAAGAAAGVAVAWTTSRVDSMKTRNDLSPELEDYLTAIYCLGGASVPVRPRDIAGFLGMHKSTVTAALKVLSARGLVEYAAYEPVRLTASGVDIAASLSACYEAVRRFLTTVLRMSGQDAADAAGMVGHLTTPEMANRLNALTDAMQSCPQAQLLRFAEVV